MKRTQEIRETIDHLIDEMAQSDEPCLNYATGIARGILWSLTGSDPSLLHIYEAMGIPTRDMGDHFHYAMSLDPAELDEPCEFCCNYQI